MNPKSYRFSALTLDQIRRLCEKLGFQQGTLLAIAVDRMAREHLDDYQQLRPPVQAETPPAPE